MAKRRRTKKPNCNHPPDQRVQVASDSHHAAGTDHVTRVVRCKLCGCWKLVMSSSDSAKAEDGRWNAPKVKYPYWIGSNKGLKVVNGGRA
jgi:hypothetical protein